MRGSFQCRFYHEAFVFQMKEMNAKFVFGKDWVLFYVNIDSRTAEAKFEFWCPG